MPASEKHILRIASLCTLIFLTASCGSLRPYKQTAGQAQNTPVPDTSSVPIDTSLDQDIRTRHLEEKINRLEQRMARLEEKLSARAEPAPPKKQVPKKLSPPPARPEKPTTPEKVKNTDPVKLYNKGRDLLLRKRNIPMAQALLSDFIKEFPDHKLADNAMYWLGECSYTTGHYVQAAKIFKTLVQTYPKGQKVPDALLKTGYAYISIDDVSQANHYFKQVITRYPFSPAADKAQKKLSQTQ
nr:tol-pal system protein YbgF [uncultured Desulfobacter sp.]